MTRRTYTERRPYSARVMRFRRGVYAARRTLSPGCALLLLRLSDDMDQYAKVSIPRSVLADDLDTSTARITDWITEAVEKRFLDRVRRGRPGVTAVYQGLIRTADEVRPGVPSQRYATPDHVEVRPGVPLKDGQRYAPGGPQEGKRTARSDQTVTPAYPEAHNGGTKDEQVPGHAGAPVARPWWHREPPDLEEPEPYADREESA